VAESDFFEPPVVFFAARTFIFFCLTLQDSQYRLKLNQQFALAYPHAKSQAQANPQTC
jgi:hypothetical protein